MGEGDFAREHRAGRVDVGGRSGVDVDELAGGVELGSGVSIKHAIQWRLRLMSKK